MSADEIAGGVICLMCGVAGSGKTTWARALEARGLVRLSIDVAVWQRFGRFGDDYPASDYEAHQAAVLPCLDAELLGLLRAGRPCVLDYSFWRLRDRERYRSLIAAYDRPQRLLVLRPPSAVLRQRLESRSSRRDPDAAFPITDDLLGVYLRDFEWPSGEGETVLPG